MKALHTVQACLKRINDTWEWIVTKLLNIMTVVMVLSIFIQVVSRMVHYTVIWTSDVATFLFVWLAFLGAAVAVRDNDHFVVDVFPGTWKKFHFNLSLNLLALAAQFVIGFIMLRYGVDFVKSMSLRLSYSLGIQLSYIVSVVPISGALILLGVLERLLKIGEISKEQEAAE
ncbi:MAG: TRAP transporter small permease subunit [Oscillibacter sp.]|nr:TRAP transporter small permease subunit [Oscillibacter sp.]